MKIRTSAATKTSVHAGMKLAKLLEMSEKDFAQKLRELEATPLFARLREMGVVVLETFAGARFSSRRMAGWDLRTESAGLPELLNEKIVALIRKVGQEKFEESFLGGEALSDEARAGACGITAAEARRLREFVDRMYAKAEFEAPQPAAAPAPVMSPVAGVALDKGEPVLSFFHRDAWKGRYTVREDRLELMTRGLSQNETTPITAILRELSLMDSRKTNLFRALEILVREQADYLETGDPRRRRPISQISLAGQLGVSASVLCRLIADKSIQLPWGLEAPIKALLPSPKAIVIQHLESLIADRPSLSDQGLRRALEQLCGAKLSRRSIAQYRKDLGLPSRRRALLT